MKAEYLYEKQLQFLAKFDEERTESINELLLEFTEVFPRRTIPNMTIENYVLGRHGIDHFETFCYWMEKKLSSFGRIAGSPAFQYGAWYGTHGKDKEVKYRHTKRYGSTMDGAFEKIRLEITALLTSGAAQDYVAIAGNMIADKLKGKLLATYFPENYLSIYAADYLDDILRYFNLDDKDSLWEPAIQKQLRLIAFKDNDAIMAGWSLMKFAMFLNDELYTHYYEKTAIKDNNQRVPEFPDLALIDPIFVNQHIDSERLPAKKESSVKFPGLKMDYLKMSIRNKAIGDRGEQIVAMMERRDLTAAGHPRLAAKVIWAAETRDGLGYDVFSKELSGADKHIEVKSTTASSGHAIFFLSRPELDKAKDLENYYIYYVFDILTTCPKVWKLANPFHPLKLGVHLEPAVYKVNIFKR
jgi:hypothetical protein